MKPVEFEGQDTLMQPPPNMERGTCGALPVLTRINQGWVTRVSVWKPDEQDLKLLAAGAHVLLHVWSESQPPVALTVERMVELP